MEYPRDIYKITCFFLSVVNRISWQKQFVWLSEEGKKDTPHGDALLRRVLLLLFCCWCHHDWSWKVLQKWANRSTKMAFVIQWLLNAKCVLQSGLVRVVLMQRCNHTTFMLFILIVSKTIKSKKVHQKVHKKVHKKVHQKVHQKVHKKVHQKVHQKVHKKSSQKKYTKKSSQKSTPESLQKKVHRKVHKKVHQKVHKQKVHQKVH